MRAIHACILCVCLCLLCGLQEVRGSWCVCALLCSTQSEGCITGLLAGGLLPEGPAGGARLAVACMFSACSIRHLTNSLTTSLARAVPGFHAYNLGSCMWLVLLFYKRPACPRGYCVELGRRLLPSLSASFWC